MINLTPLIDVVFVLLIVFILITPLLELDKVNLADGPTQIVEHAAPTQNSSKVVIHVRDDDTILLNKQIVSLKQLEAELGKAYSIHPKACPQVFHDRKATFGAYQSIKNAVEAAGFTEMDVILKPS
jgi:biopolymer transport protein ExbD